MATEWTRETKGGARYRLRVSPDRPSAVLEVEDGGGRARVKLNLRALQELASDCKLAYLHLVADGHQITLDWTVDFEPDALRQHPRVYAERDAEAIREAEVLVFVDCHTTSPGAWWEVGYAYALGKPVFALVAFVGELQKKVFLFLPEVRLFENNQQLCRGLNSLRVWR